MARFKLRIVLFALIGSILVVAPASAEDPAPLGERSALETPDPLSTVWLSFTGSDQLNAAASAGIDVEHNIVRVPNGIEAPAIVTEEQLALLDTMGVEVISDAERFTWDLSEDAASSSFALRSGSSSPFSALETLIALDHEATVRIVRADYFTTKGQGFLYVEARTTLGQQSNPVITMQLANNTGPSTPFGTARNMSRFVDSGVYMFHRNLVKVAVRPSEIRVTSSTGGTATGYVSDWLEEPVAADRHARLQVRLRRQLQDRAAALRALRGDRASSIRGSPRSSSCRTRRTGTSGRRRRRSAARVRRLSSSPRPRGATRAATTSPSAS